jgi:L-rhamnose isomerase
MNANQDQIILDGYSFACDRYRALGVDPQTALDRLKAIPISLHCWQGDDVGGFETSSVPLGGGIAVTGNYPGKARTVEELRSDLELAYSLIPGRHRLNLHASYGEFGGKQVDRNEVSEEHFSGWIDWAREQGLGLDFNPTFFSHPKADDGFTLAHPDEGIRNFWIEHGIASRRIGAAMSKALGKSCITNVWIPDGFKDLTVDRRAPRERLTTSLDRIFAEDLEVEKHWDAVECKLFGLGSETYVAGSHEFYMGYAIQKQIALCLDAGHFHPTEVISDKISAVMPYVPRLLLHVSRGVRWDSDHVVVLTDELQSIAAEIVRGNYLDRVQIGLDFFDASINRIAAWVIGTRAMIKALLIALLEPVEKLRTLELEGDYTARLMLIEELKLFPVGLIWDYYCLEQGLPVGNAWLDEVRRYEQQQLSTRG